MNPRRHWQRGFSSITAIFLVVVLAVLAAAGAQMYARAQDDQTFDLQSMRARSAARGGLQLGFWHAANNACAGTTNITNMPASLARFTVTLSCVMDGPYSDGAGVSVRRYRFQAVACNQPAAAATACPNNVAAANGTYVESVVSAECTIASNKQLECR